MKRSPMRQRYKPTGPDAATVGLVRARDGYRCVRCGVLLDGWRGLNWSLQHRKPRAMGGTDDPAINAPSNLLAVCGSGTTGCHGHMESNRAEARGNGWLLWHNADPRAAAVLVDQQRRWVYLGDDGAYHDNPPERAS